MVRVNGLVERSRRTPPLVGPGSPPAVRVARARWRDARMLAGVLLVLISVAIGARVLAAADDTTPVWAAAHDLASGTTLRADDVVRRDVRLQSAASAYLSAKSAPPVGYVLAREVTSGELVPAGAVKRATSVPDRRLVTVPVERFHRPGDLRRGLRVDVYVTGTGSNAAQTSLVLAGATVDEVLADGGRLGPSGDSVGVSLSVAPDDVRTLVAASRSGTIDLVLAPVAIT